MSQRINIDSNLWGPKGWFFLDTIVLSYPEMPSFNDIKIFKNCNLQIIFM